jgi:hypothetical protein
MIQHKRAQTPTVQSLHAKAGSERGRVQKTVQAQQKQVDNEQNPHSIVSPLRGGRTAKNSTRGRMFLESFHHPSYLNLKIGSRSNDGGIRSETRGTSRAEGVEGGNTKGRV